MGKLASRRVDHHANDSGVPLRDGHRSTRKLPKRSEIAQNTQKTLAVGVTTRPSRSPLSISPSAYLTALSQTDTIEQARWLHAMDTSTRRRGSA
jgi:hypothetical protein